MRKMWQFIVQSFPESHLNTWFNWLTVMAILLPIAGGISGLLAWGINARLTAIKDESDTAKTKRLTTAEQTLVETREKLVEAEHQITKLQPKPLKVRVIGYLQRLDNRIMEAAKTGQRDFSGTFTTAQLAELQSLCSEDAKGLYISLVPTTNIIIPGPGQHGGIAFRITDELIK